MVPVICYFADKIHNIYETQTNLRSTLTEKQNLFIIYTYWITYVQFGKEYPLWGERT